jgi:hypothetical protein
MAQVDSFRTVMRASCFLLFSAVLGLGFGYLLERLGLWVGLALAMVAAAAGFFFTAEDQRLAHPAHFQQAANSPPAVPWYGDLGSWALAFSMGSIFAAQELFRGHGVTRAAAYLVGGTLACHIVSVVAPRLYPPPNFDRPSILKQSDKPF